MRSTKRKQRGFTLVECLIACALLAFTVVAIAQAVSAGQTETSIATINLRGISLAESLMEEILSKPYADPQGSTTFGPDSGETTRLLYDNIDDYHNFSESASAIKDASNTLMPTDYQAFTRSVTVVAGSQTVTGLGTAITGVTVTVTVNRSNLSKSWTLTRFVPDPSQ